MDCDPKQVDPALSQLCQRLRQLCPRIGLGDMDMRRQATIEIAAQIAMAAGIIDDADRRCLAGATKPAPRSAARVTRFDPGDLTELVDRRCHIDPYSG